jgi:hypothetical protein
VAVPDHSPKTRTTIEIAALAGEVPGEDAVHVAIVPGG